MITKRADANYMVDSIEIMKTLDGKIKSLQAADSGEVEPMVNFFDFCVKMLEQPGMAESGEINIRNNIIRAFRIYESMYIEKNDETQSLPEFYGIKFTAGRFNVSEVLDAIYKRHADKKNRV